MFEFYQVKKKILTFSETSGQGVKISSKMNTGFGWVVIVVLMSKPMQSALCQNETVALLKRYLKKMIISLCSYWNWYYYYY